MNQHTIGIDLGASYTKVAYRVPMKRDPVNGTYQMESDILAIQQEVTVPTMVVRTGDSQQPWLLGHDAARATPSPEMRVFENWKSEFYSDEFDARKVELIAVAGQFFQWLAGEVVACGAVLDRHSRVRVTIPGLKRIERQQGALKECMSLHGWPDSIEVVLEPVANLLGVVTAGRNVISNRGRMHYGHMLGAAVDRPRRQLFDEMRSVALKYRRDPWMKVTIIDFGSFTLDIAQLNTDLRVQEYESFPVTDIAEKSWEIGVIDALDNRALRAILERQGIEPNTLPYQVRENAKRELYSGNAFALPGRRIAVGNTSDDQELLTRTIEDYCRQAWAELEPFCRESELTVVTGGGASIPAVRVFLTKQLRQLDRDVVFSEATTGRVSDERKNYIDRWEDTGLGLDRLATCIGSASIGFGFDSAQ